MTAMAAEPMVLPEEVAELLRMEERAVRRACARQEIPSIKVGKYWRIKAQWLAHVTTWTPPAESEVA